MQVGRVHSKSALGMQPRTDGRDASADAEQSEAQARHQLGSSHTQPQGKVQLQSSVPATRYHCPPARWRAGEVALQHEHLGHTYM